MDRIGALLMGVCVLLCASVAYARKPRSVIIDSLNVELKNARSSADSIPVLYNIFDLSLADERLERIEKIYDVAVNAGNERVQIDALRHIANIGAALAKPDITQSAIDRVQSLPDSENKRQALLFMNVSLFNADRIRSEEQRAVAIRAIFREMAVTNPGENIYTDIEQMFKLLLAMSGTTQGTAFINYVEKLDAALSKLPATDSPALRNLFYNCAAMAYWRNDQLDRCLDADRHLLHGIDELEREYRVLGREHRKFYSHRYMAMRRMLRGIDYLSIEEVDSIYHCMEQLAALDPDVHKDMYEDNIWSTGAVLMKHGKYAEAIPYFRHTLVGGLDIYDRRFFLRWLRRAAREAGDDATFHEANALYVTVLENYVKEQNIERERELSIVSELNRMRSQTRAREFRRSRKLAIAGYSIAAVLLVALLVFMWLARRYRRRLRDITAANSKLLSEVCELRDAQQSLIDARNRAREVMNRKSQLIEYISHEISTPLLTINEYTQMIVDNVPEDKRSYLQRFAAVVEMNARMLHEIMADVQEYVRLDSHTLRLKPKPLNLPELSSQLADNVRLMLYPGVEMELRSLGDPMEMPLVTLDWRGVSVVLLTILTLSVRQTHSGSVVLAYGVEPDGKVRFEITDSGKPIPPEMAAQVFSERIVASADSGDAGLGLPVCGMLVRAMGGTIRLLPHESGNRFILILPQLNSDGNQ